MTIAIQGTSGLQELVCEGAHVIISYVHPHIDWRDMPGPLGPREAETGLRWFLPAPGPDDVRGYLAAAEQKRPIVFLRRNLGLTHPDLPFHESANVVFLSNPDDVASILDLADQVPCGLQRHCMDCQCGMVPFTFPPAIDDWDSVMQANMLELGMPFAGPEEAANFFHDKLEEQEVDLSEELAAEVIDELDNVVGVVDEAIAKANRLAREALICLRRHHSAVRWVSELLSEVVESAAYQLRIRQEQEAVRRRWDAAPPTKNRHSAKRERKKLREACAEVQVQTRAVVESPMHRLRGILTDFQNKVFKYRHYTRAFAALRSTGLSDLFSGEQVHGSHRVLHGAGVNSVTLVRPHGVAREHTRHRFARSLMGVATAAVHAPLAEHFGP
eukprot:UN0533